MARTPAEPICKECGLRVRVPPAPGEPCQDCKAARAWTEHADGGLRLVVDLASIEEAEARRAGDAKGTPLWRRVLRYVPASIAGVLAAAATAALLPLFSLRPMGPIRSVLAEWRSDSVSAAAWGGASLVAGIVALVAARRGPLFRSWIVLALVSASSAAGLLTAAVGAFSAVISTSGWGMLHDSVPPVTPQPAAPYAERVMRATVTIFAPGADGDARGGAIGTGAVVRSEPGRAWIVTCRHVATPHVAFSSSSDARTALPVWVQLADGRDAAGVVRWTGAPPLDVALVSVDVENPPPAVEVSSDDSGVLAGTEVLFVPNPLRGGWLVHRGGTVRRESHSTPAGECSLIYTDLPVQHGDSGSGLYDAQGTLVGINTWAMWDKPGPVGIGLPAAALAGALAAAEPPAGESGGSKR